MNKKLYLNKICKIVVLSDSKRLFYTAEVLDLSDGHISFIDKFGVYYTYSMKEVVEINTQN